MAKTVQKIPMLSAVCDDANDLREFHLELLPKLKTVQAYRNEPLLGKRQQCTVLHFLLKGEMNVASNGAMRPEATARGDRPRLVQTHP